MWLEEKLLLQLNPINTKLQMGQVKFRQIKPDKPQCCSLASSVQTLQPIISNGNTTVLGCTATFSKHVALEKKSYILIELTTTSYMISINYIYIKRVPHFHVVHDT